MLPNQKKLTGNIGRNKDNYMYTSFYVMFLTFLYAFQFSKLFPKAGKLEKITLEILFRIV